jgi:hypothetical protein
LRGHPFGGDADQRLGIFVRAGVGEDFDVDLVLGAAELFEGEAHGLLDRVGLDFDARPAVRVHAVSSLGAPSAEVARRP